MTIFEIRRPLSLGDLEWEAVLELQERINRADVAQDFALIVGTAKELIEAVAKMVIQTRGGSFSSGASFDELLNDAHRALDRQPGAGLATAPPVRDMAQAMKHAAVAVRKLRSTHGTGHGRTLASEAIEEHASMAGASALIWCSWALRRLDRIVEGRLVSIVTELQTGGIFYRNTLHDRLVAANLQEVDQPDLQRLGLAVGRRAANGTHTVREEGMEWPIAMTAPEAYRRGAIEGAFISSQGLLKSTGATALAALSLLRTLDEQSGSAVARVLAQHAQTADVAYETVAEIRRAVVVALDSSMLSFSPGIAADLTAVRTGFAE